MATDEALIPDVMPRSGQTLDVWANHLPDGAVSVEASGGKLVLRASRTLQQRFETLLEKRKTGTAAPEELAEYDSIADLDDALSWLNRVMRGKAS